MERGRGRGQAEGGQRRWRAGPGPPSQLKYDAVSCLHEEDDEDAEQDPARVDGVALRLLLGHDRGQGGAHTLAIAHVERGEVQRGGHEGSLQESELRLPEAHDVTSKDGTKAVY